MSCIFYNIKPIKSQQKKSLNQIMHQLYDVKHSEGNINNTITRIKITLSIKQSQKTATLKTLICVSETNN